GLRASRKLKPRAFSLDVANGQHEAVEAIDALHLCLPSGLEIVLNNCHYAPSITRGVIFVSRLAKLDLESSLLWHCRLGHISKKRIEKLKHDGLLDSSDPMAFEKYVSYRMCLYIDAEKPELGDLGEATNYKAALLDPQSKKWLNAINVEMQSIKDNEVWVLVELPLNGKTIGSTWLFKKKTDMDGVSVKSYLGRCFAMKDLGKAAYILGIKIYRDRSRRIIGLCQSAYIEKILKRYCMENSKRGSSIMYAMRCTRPDVTLAQNVTSRFQQNPRIDYEETFSLVADIRAIRILIAIAAYYDYEIWQMDVTTAFLNGYLNEEVYMKQPEGFVNPKYQTGYAS
nr:retrotransposon protein, putative, Ty1-copia subclass, expressed [Tanacetum cinerariifolium]